LHQGEPAWTLVSSRHRRLRQEIPIEGKVLAVNETLLKDPGLVQRSPYAAGWILQVRPRNLQNSIRNLLPGTAAGGWVDAARVAISRRSSPSLGALAHDVGEYGADFADRLDDADWEAIKRELFPTTDPLSGAS
jgi:hypothetical protein